MAEARLVQPKFGSVTFEVLDTQAELAGVNLLNHFPELPLLARAFGSLRGCSRQRMNALQRELPEDEADLAGVLSADLPRRGFSAPADRALKISEFDHCQRRLGIARLVATGAHQPFQ